MYAIILGFITAFTLTFLMIPVIIRVARERRLYDKPNERSAHIEPTPSLGGIGIFAGAICGIVLWTPLEVFGVLQYIFAAFVMLFLIGVLDDIMPMSPMKKFIGQLLAAAVLAYKAGIRITDLHGVLGVTTIPEISSFVLSIVVIVGIINAVNLIDGINGLAGSIGLLACLLWGSWFFVIDEMAFAMVAFSLAGGIIAFLKYNFTPARIFMGDTGSLLIGLVCAVMTIHFIEMNHKDHIPAQYVFQSAPAIAFAMLIVPLFDTFRVFFVRIAQGRSPFHPDRNHIHHLLLDIGLNHLQATLALVSATIIFVIATYLLHNWGTLILILLQLSVATSATYLLYRRRLALEQKRNNTHQSQ
ncbi:MAG: undecaprenyl/decaprenyl-phosphate alpha-N-acetylglucosaminyl 1-phosphate transferase [Chitinophagales bacterium]|nr:undecaprenyl/decaprenyl-phosphate alpha-N-acetylglucosaminyl 1-phosphate transferase [Chitinophagales bacterium]